MRILGTRVVRKEDPKLLTAGGTYVEDVQDPRLDGAARITFVRSTMAHARIASIDVRASAPPVEVADPAAGAPGADGHRTTTFSTVSLVGP